VNSRSAAQEIVFLLWKAKFLHRASFETYKAVTFQVEVYCVMTPCPCCLHLHLQDGSSMDTAS